MPDKQNYGADGCQEHSAWFVTLTLPDITKYRALDADLIDGEHWRKNKYTLLQQSHFTKLAEEPEKLIKQMAMELDTRLYEVGEYLEQDYYRQLDELSVNTP